MATSAYELAAAQLKIAIDTAFAAEGFVAAHDQLHESLGWNGTQIGIAPIRDVVNTNNYIQETWIQVQFFGQWMKEITPTTAVDPRIVTNYAERFRRAVQDRVVPPIGIADVMWYFNLVEIEYPRDPNGNNTRFVARLRAWGNNSALVETTA